MGSVDEEEDVLLQAVLRWLKWLSSEDQRGMAHMLEHICFLGSEKRMRLQSAGLGRSPGCQKHCQMPKMMPKGP